MVGHEPKWILRDSPLTRFAFAFIIMSGITYYFFSPVFNGYTQSEVASARNLLYPWAYQPVEGVGRNDADQAVEFYPWQVFFQDALRSRDFPLWNPYSFAGQPFFANGQNGALDPPRILLSLVTTPTKVHDWLMLSHMLLAGLLMFLLLSDARLSFGPSLFGAIAWMLNSFMLGWMNLEVFLTVEAWLPLAFLLTGAALRRRSYALGLWLGVVLALMSLGGGLLFVEFAFIVIAGYGGSLVWAEWRAANLSLSRLAIRHTAGYVLALATPLLITVGLIAVRLIPTWATGRSADRSVCTYTELISFAVPFEYLVHFFFYPRDAIDVNYSLLFLGTPTAILALIGFFRRHSLVAYSRAVAIVVLLVATGTPLLWVFYELVPGVGHLKPLGRFLFLFNFAVALLAAFGLEWVMELLSNRAQLRGLSRFACRSGLTAALAAIVVLQMHQVSAALNNYERDSAESLYPTTPLIQALNDRINTRILPIDKAFYGSTAMIFKLQNSGGFDSVIPERTGKLWRAVENSSPTVAFQRSPIWGPCPVFTIDSALDMLPRLAVTHLVVPPIEPTGWRKSNLPDRNALNNAILSQGNFVPLIGDWEGDGFDTAGFFDTRTNTFYLGNSAEADGDQITFQIGNVGQGWAPLVGDWNGDHIDTVSFYDPASSTFHIRNSNESGPDDIVIQYGDPGRDLIPLAGDWEGRGVDSVGVYDSKRSIFHLRRGAGPGPTAETKFPFGSPPKGCIPIVGDWDGDKIAGIGLYDPKESVFYLKNVAAPGTSEFTIPYNLPNRELRPVSGRWHKDISSHLVDPDIAALFDPATADFYVAVPAFLGPIILEKAYAGDDGDIYKVNNPVPRAYLVPQAQVVESPTAALSRFTDLSFDPMRAVIIESDQLKKSGGDYDGDSTAAVASDRMPAVTQVSNGGAAGGEPTGSAEIIKRTLNSLTLQVDAPRDEWLVVMESWDAGWSANVDGRPTPVLAGDYAFRTMKVPAGRHEVEMAYRPVGFMLGSSISGATVGFLLIVGVAWLVRRTRRRFTGSR